MLNTAGFENIDIEKLKEHELETITDLLFKAEIGKKYYPTKDTLSGLLKDGYPDDHMYTVKDEEDIVGFVWFQEKGAFYVYPYLQMIFVREDYRKTGLGKKLLDFFEEQSLNGPSGKKIKSKVFLCVGEWNEGAIRFYDRAGYREVGMLPGLFRKKVNEKLYMKECFAGDV